MSFETRVLIKSRGFEPRVLKSRGLSLTKQYVVYPFARCRCDLRVLLDEIIPLDRIVANPFDFSRYDTEILSENVL